MNNQPKQSSFINTFAWITIVFSGLGVVIGIMQNMITVMKDRGIELIILMGTLVLTVITLISAIALLKRKNWARLFFIVLLVVGILWNVIAGYMQFDMMSSMMFAGEKIQNMQSTMKIVMGVIIVAILALHIYLIKCLSSDKIKSEFLGLVK